MKRSGRLSGLTGLVLFWLATGLKAGVEPAHLVTGFPRSQAVLVTTGPRCLRIDLYVASTEEQRAQGLMYVEVLPEFEGMYFGYGAPVEIAMWMKNTVLSLDMLFIREDGAVGQIARNTRPQSTDRITSNGPVVGVLELSAGFARRWRVEPGSRLLLF